MAQTNEHIEKLQERLRILKARQAVVDARRRTLEEKRNRKAELRRKLLIAEIVLTKVEEGIIPEASLREWLDKALTRPADRQLFNLG